MPLLRERRPRAQAAYWLILLPAVVMLVALYLVPLADVLVTSVTDPKPGLDNYALLFTSANGVAGFLGRLPELGLDLRVLGKIKLAAIGPKTAAALRDYHLQADLVPATFQSEDLALALRRAKSWVSK